MWIPYYAEKVEYISSSFSFLGEKSSRDEQVACAMLATQLDNFLGGDPVQHRQVQGYESPEFMNLFPRGVSYKVRYEIMLTHATTQEKRYEAATGVVKNLHLYTLFRYTNTNLKVHIST